MPIRLAIIDQSFHWPPTGGSWVDLRETAVRLQNHGFEVQLFVPHWERWGIPGGRILENPGFPVKVLPIKPRQFNFHSLPKIYEKAVSAWNPDMILISNSFYLAPYLIEKFSKNPVFLRIYAFEMACLNYMNMNKCDTFHWEEQNPHGELCGKNLLNNPWECWLCGLKAMDGTLIGPRLNCLASEYWTSLAFLPGFSEKVKKALNKCSGAMVNNPYIRGLFSDLDIPVHVVPGGIDTDHFTVSPESPGEKVRILMSGRADDQKKGSKTFLESIDILQQENVSFEAFITDSRNEFSDPRVQSTGWVNYNALPSLYNSMDIIVCPSIWPEPFGLVALEAMASGIPVVASDIGGFHYTVQHERTGLLFSPGHSRELSQCLKRLILDPNLRLQMGKAGRTRAELFKWDNVVSMFTCPILKLEATAPLDWTVRFSVQT